MRYLAIDPGTKRIGLAVGDDETGIVSPVTVIEYASFTCSHCAEFAEKSDAEIVQMVDRNEYKRRQAAPGVRITRRAFGRDRRYPITSRYREF